MLWPFDIVGAEYFPSAGPLQAAGVSVGHNVLAGLRLSLTARGARGVEDEISAAEVPDQAGNLVRRLPDQRTADLFRRRARRMRSRSTSRSMADLVGVYFRYLDDFGDPVVIPAPGDCIEQIGFDERDSLFPRDNRVFRGSELLREYFVFPRKFLGFKLTKLEARHASPAQQERRHHLCFRRMNPRLSAAVQPGFFSLYSAPAINLFEKTTDRIVLKSSFHEYHVVPDRSHHLNFEAHRILDVYAHYPGEKDKVPVAPLYSAEGGRWLRETGFSTRSAGCRAGARSRKRPSARRQTTPAPICSFPSGSVRECDRAARRSNSAFARCAPTAISPNICRSDRAARISSCSTIPRCMLTCVAGPTLPREPVASQLHSRNETTQGAADRLAAHQHAHASIISGLTARGAGNQAEALQRNAVDVRRRIRQRDRAQDSRRPPRRQPADRETRSRADRQRHGAGTGNYRDRRREGI